MKVAIIAGEASGDQLGAGLLQALKQKLEARGETLQALGLGGPKMIAQGFESIAPMEWLSVMGIIEPLKRLPLLLRLRRNLFNRIVNEKVDLVIGIDSPDFNLGLERKLKELGFPVCHYVCPSVWAWRQKRVFNIRRSVDHVLALLPFEQSFLKQYDIESTFVGHPVADRFKRQFLDDNKTLEQRSDINSHSGLVCVMPGSRHSELDRLLDPFVRTIKLCLEKKPDLRFVIPAANASLKRRIDLVLDKELAALKSRVELLDGQSHEAMQRSDLIVTASGTATLEAGLLARPMVMAYRMSRITYWIAKRLVKLKRFSLPNLLLDQDLIPELIQDKASPESLAKELFLYLDDEAYYKNTQRLLAQLLPMLALDADKRAADAVIELVDRKKIEKQ